MDDLEFEELCKLLAQARRGDSGALDRLCEILYPRVSALVHQSLQEKVHRRRPWLSSVFSTSDFVQEAFIGAVRQIHEIHVPSAAGLIQYLATTIKNQILDAVRFHEASRRDQRRLGKHHSAELRAACPDPTEEAVTAEEIARYYLAIQCFDARERTLLQERIENATPYDQLYEALGYASPDSARKAFHLLQAKLLARLTRIIPGA